MYYIDLAPNSEGTMVRMAFWQGLYLLSSTIPSLVFFFKKKIKTYTIYLTSLSTPCVNVEQGGEIHLLERRHRKTSVTVANSVCSTEQLRQTIWLYSMGH